MLGSRSQCGQEDADLREGEEGREGGREEGREGGTEGGREAGREGGKEAGREGGRVGGRERGQEEGLSCMKDRRLHIHVYMYCTVQERIILLPFYHALLTVVYRHMGNIGSLMLQIKSENKLPPLGSHYPVPSVVHNNNISQ